MECEIGKKDYRDNLVFWPMWLMFNKWQDSKLKKVFLNASNHNHII